MVWLHGSVAPPWAPGTAVTPQTESTSGRASALVHGLSHGLDYRAMVRALRQLPIGAIGLSIGATVLSFVALIGRELCGLRYVGARVPMTTLAVASFCGNALGNAVGLGALSGGAPPAPMYPRGRPPPAAGGGGLSFIP